MSSGLGISNSALEWIQNNLGEEITPEVSTLMLQLVSGDLTPKTHLYSSNQKPTQNPYEERSIEELESMLEGNFSVGNITKNGIKKALLIAYCRETNVEKAEALLEVCKIKSTNYFVLVLHIHISKVKLILGQISEF